MMQQASDLVASALERLAEEDETLALTAAEAYQGVVVDCPTGISQLMVQRFLWMDIPRRWPPAGRARAAEALGRLLDACGMGRYAAICRSEETSRILDSYVSSAKRGYRRARKALLRSGVVPPGIPGLEWDVIHSGPAEYLAFLEASVALELAICAGELQVSSRAPSDRQVELTCAYLERPQPSLDGRSHLEAVYDERIESWVESGSPRRQQVLAPLADELRRAVPLPATGLEALAWLLTRCAEGLPVGRDGPSEEVVGEHRDRFGPITTSTPEIEPAHVFLDVLLDAGLAHRMGRRVRTTPRGDRLRADAEGLWRAVVAYLWRPNTFHNAVAELAFALLLAEPLTEGELAAHIHPMLQTHWRDVEEGLPTSHDQARVSLIRLVLAAEPLGVLDAQGSFPHRGQGWPDRTLALTELGRGTALEALRQRATAPRR